MIHKGRTTVRSDLIQYIVHYVKYMCITYRQRCHRVWKCHLQSVVRIISGLMNIITLIINSIYISGHIVQISYSGKSASRTNRKIKKYPGQPGITCVCGVSVVAARGRKRACRRLPQKKLVVLQPLTVTATVRDNDFPPHGYRRY